VIRAMPRVGILRAVFALMSAKLIAPERLALPIWVEVTCPRNFGPELA
jgi:hypothetical protein